MINDKLYEVIRFPIVTEKSSILAGSNQHVFKVKTDATKEEIKKAIEQIFSVKVDKVRTINVKGKTKRFKGTKGCRSDYKKAIVCLAEGQNLELGMGA